MTVLRYFYSKKVVWNNFSRLKVTTVRISMESLMKEMIFTKEWLCKIEKSIHCTAHSVQKYAIYEMQLLLLWTSFVRWRSVKLFPRKLTSASGDICLPTFQILASRNEQIKSINYQDLLIKDRNYWANQFHRFFFIINRQFINLKSLNIENWMLLFWIEWNKEKLKGVYAASLT